MRIHFVCIAKPRPCRLTKPGLLGYNIPKRTLFSSQTLYHRNVILMTVRGSDERSSRFYTEDVQQDYCTYEKLKCLFPHSRHLLPAADCGKGKEGLTAICNSVRLYYSIYRRTLSTNRLFRRFLCFYCLSGVVPHPLHQVSSKQIVGLLLVVAEPPPGVGAGGTGGVGPVEPPSPYMVKVLQLGTMYSYSLNFP